MIRIISNDDGSPDRPLVMATGSPEDTEQLGELIARLLPPDTVISLNGDLGAGKTALTRGLARGLGCLWPVSSPTFTLLMEHPARADGLALYHFDTYRLEEREAEAVFAELGFETYFDAGGVCAVEWGEKIADLLPARTLVIRMFRSDSKDETARRITLSWPDDSRLTQLRLAVAARQADVSDKIKESDSHADPGL